MEGGIAILLLIILGIIIGIVLFFVALAAQARRAGPGGDMAGAEASRERPAHTVVENESPVRGIGER